MDTQIESEAEFLRRRAAEESEAARSSACLVRAVHEEAAELYEGRAALEDAEQALIHSADASATD